VWLIVLFVLVALLPLLVWILFMLRSKRLRVFHGVAAATWLILVAGISWTASWRLAPHESTVDPADSARPVELAARGYVSSRTCGACHPKEHASWDTSYHSKMTQHAVAGAVLAPFDGVVLEAEGRLVHLERRGDSYWANFVARAEANGDESDWRQIMLSTGSHHFQMYWTSTGIGRELELFPFAYEISEARWIPADNLVLSDPKRIELTSVWNRDCIGCHSTGGLPRLVSDADSQLGELGIACEACHGPGEEHVRANADVARRYELHVGGRADPTIVNPARLPHDRSAEVCGQCHSVQHFYSDQDANMWSKAGFRYRPGDTLADTRKIINDDDNTTVEGESSFWADEMIRVNGREYNSLLRSPCFERGELTCISCHSLHLDSDDTRPLQEWANDQLTPEKARNQACVQCHDRFADQQQLAAHTHHAPESPGSTCYDCHMPNSAYGLQKATRSHEITNPSLAGDLQVGRPNACNLCHLDRPLAWTAKHLASWYDIEKPPLDDVQQRVAASVVWTLAGDAGQRALVAWHMGWGPARQASGTHWMAPFLAELMADPYPAVRGIAGRSLRTLPGFEDLAYDSQASSDDRKGAQQRAMGLWNTRKGTDRRSAFRTLVMRDGSLDSALYADLRKRRDNRFLWVSE
jgi:nitrate/TMAO reductase-like tetraheme cytochrome c subunit